MRKFTLLFGTLIGAVFFFFITIYIQMSIFDGRCPDCGEPGKLFYFFFSLKSDNGYNPFPTVYNFALTIIIGIFIGYIVTKRLLRKPERI